MGEVVWARFGALAGLSSQNDSQSAEQDLRRTERFARVGNIGEVEKEEKAKSVVQVMNANRGKDNEVWSVGRYVKIRNEELGMSSQQGKGYTGAGLARRRPEVVNPGAPEDPETTPL